MLTLIITLIETVYTFLWGDLITLPLPGGGTLGLPLLVLLLIPTWFIISTFFIFLSINSFHNPLYDTAICIPSSLYTTYGFPVF